MKFVGIDLAWTYKNETGICILNENGGIEFLDAANYSDQDILSILIKNNSEKLSIGIDAPLIVKNSEKSRSAEREFMKTKIHNHRMSVFQVSRNYLIRTYGKIRGEILLQLILKNITDTIVNPIPLYDKNTVTETFPSAIACGLFPEIFPIKYKIKPKIPYRYTQQNMSTLLKRIRHIEENEKTISRLIDSELLKTELNRKNHKHIEDQVDAFLCAYGLYCIYKEKANPLIFGNVYEGFITVPIKNSK